MDEALLRLVWQRAASRCEYCLMPQEYDTLTFQVDHIIAHQHGGPTRASNLALACFACNHHKGPNISGIDFLGSPLLPVRLFHPRRHKWSRHFHYHGAELRGRTAIGRVSVQVLAINLPHRLALRDFLMKAHLFFP
jgi:hypothetical protein